jgi:hypothetical protein
MKRESSDLPPVNAAAVSDSRIVKNDVVTQDSGMTFQRLALWTEESTLKMRMMSTLVGEAKGKVAVHSNGKICRSNQHATLGARGGALISAIHSHTLHGDPSVREFADRVLEEVSLSEVYLLSSLPDTEAVILLGVQALLQFSAELDLFRSTT